MEYVFSGDEYPDGRFNWDYYSVVCIQEPELPISEVLGRDHIGVEAEVFVVCVFVASVSLVSYGFDC